MKFKVFQGKLDAKKNNEKPKISNKTPPQMESRESQQKFSDGNYQKITRSHWLEFIPAFKWFLLQGPFGLHPNRV